MPPQNGLNAALKNFTSSSIPGLVSGKKKIGDTIYGIGWVPFGGYVKISGMIDESMDKEQLKQPAKSYEFRSKPAWQRLIIMVAGVIMNILLALFLFIMLTYKWGDELFAAAKFAIWFICGFVRAKNWFTEWR